MKIIANIGEGKVISKNNIEIEINKETSFNDLGNIVKDLSNKELDYFVYRGFCYKICQYKNAKVTEIKINDGDKIYCFVDDFVHEFVETNTGYFPTMNGFAMNTGAPIVAKNLSLLFKYAHNDNDPSSTVANVKKVDLSQLMKIGTDQDELSYFLNEQKVFKKIKDEM